MPPAVAMMPRFPGQPPGLDIDVPALLLGALLEETTVAETLFLKVANVDVGNGVAVSSAAVVDGMGMTVTVEGDEDGVSEGEIIVGSTADVDVVSGVEVTVASTAEIDVIAGIEMETEGDSRVEGSVTGIGEEWVEGVVVLSETPVMTLKTEDWLGTGKTTLDEGAISDVVPWLGVTVTVTIGFSVTVTTSESHEEDP